MQDPRNQIREYLKKLIDHYLYIKSLDKQLKLISEWKVPRRFEALNIAAYFFTLVTYSFSRSILIEICKLLSEREEKSLIDWLNKAKEHASALGPTRYNPSNHNGARLEPIEPGEYCSIVESQISELDAKKEVIERIKVLRDRALVHSDSTYFNNPGKLYKHYPLTQEDIDSLMAIVSDILKWQHIYLFESDLSMEVHSISNVDSILSLALAFSRARQDRELIKKGFRPIEYLRDDYA